MTKFQRATFVLFIAKLALGSAVAFAQAAPQAPQSNTTRPVEPIGSFDLPIATRQMVFSIPFSVYVNDVPPVEVQLLVSSDRGASWNVYARQPPTAKQFLFRTTAEGEYWFVAKTTLQANSAPSLESIRPELKVAVDTTPPKLQLDAAIGDGGQMEVQWQSSDVNLMPHSLTIEHLPIEGGQPAEEGWQRVAIELPAIGADQTKVQGKTSWWPETDAQLVRVRALVQDRAGNRAELNRQVIRTRSEFAQNEKQSAIPQQPGSPAAVPGKLASTDGPSLTSPVPPSIASPTEKPTEQNSETDQRTIANDEKSLNDKSNVQLPAGEQIRWTNSQRIYLEYDVASVGTYGVKQVELWGTRDGGLTWDRWATDPDNESPILVEVPGDGLYGFQVVITSGLGHSSSAPRGGEMADLWIGIDRTQPTAKILSAPFGSGETAGNLIVHWTSHDEHPAANPVELMYRLSSQGPWTTIAADLPAIGQYAWQVDPAIGREVYLQLKATDEAGNAKVHQIDHPINLEALRPQGRIRSFRPASKQGM